MSLSWRTVGRARILDFDCEARPLSWIGGDFVSKEVTAIAAKFIDEPGDVQVWLLGDVDALEMLESFRALYDQATMVTGHFIRGFDCPLINAALMEHGRPPLASKLAHDTKLDLVKRHGLSASQASLGAMLGLEHPKVGMNQSMWRAANRLTPEGLELTRARVAGDVLQHIELRRRLMDLGYLGAPKVWRSGAGVGHTYRP